MNRQHLYDLKIYFSHILMPRRQIHLVHQICDLYLVTATGYGIGPTSLVEVKSNQKIFEKR